MHVNETLLQLQELSCQSYKQPLVSEYYNIFLLEGSGAISIDFVEYTYSGKIALFTSPYQYITIASDTDLPIRQLAFHGDFYCIEYHKQEVACNGLLFNNIYKQPFIPLFDNELDAIFDKIRSETALNQPYSEPILRTYLQLILAIGSRIKRQQQDLVTTLPPQPIEQFRELLELHFITHRSADFYAAELAMAPGTFAKKCKKYFGKSPLQLLQERVVLEAKKQLHLTHKSVKEVAAVLNFSDEHYFSRFFKKHTGVSPTVFREKVGISIVADLSMR
ncbi:helix-turn-helix domain-containing protein [Pontibacter burrus]|uniref:AraC family transcriptional regulator n=1 Tax=Pontibacter burrus TaxID=2704466 RepID=A0A6B3LTX8_9BACT|nr:AraC family transcriptional regulator [Pontibacter burrus]NEM97706.1 AraC family transcriptional regulator [Pontibacter burrus]